MRLAVIATSAGCIAKNDNEAASQPGMVQLEMQPWDSKRSCAARLGPAQRDTRHEDRFGEGVGVSPRSARRVTAIGPFSGTFPPFAANAYRNVHGRSHALRFRAMSMMRLKRGQSR